MVKLLVIRHGKTQWNLDKKIQGQRDIPLCAEGIAELETCRIPGEFSAFQWISSPLIRAQQTAQLLGAKDLSLEPSLIEMDWGGWDGYSLAELRSKYGAAMTIEETKGLKMCPPGGESPADVAMRVGRWLKCLRHDTIAITHKGVIRALKSLAYDWDMTDKSPVKFDWSAGHLFELDTEGMPAPVRVNIRLKSA
ncbi:MAG: hypothetical protein COB93_05670 [Sneathiella sp.]|nr:MAG: hypothetical protein COB93_05670 [Sneathiella sp.]